MKKKPFAYEYSKPLELVTGIDVNQEDGEQLFNVNESFLKAFEAMGYDVVTITIDWRDPQTVWFYRS